MVVWVKVLTLLKKKKENSGKWRKTFLFCELDEYKITMDNFTQFKRLSDICVKQHLREATFAQSDICAKRH
jgi:hypothetical protein